MKKFVFIAVGLGFLVAMFLGCYLVFANNHALGPTAPAPFISRAIVWVWPTAIMLIDADANRAGYTIMAISWIINGLLYGLAAFCAASVWSLFTSKGKWV